MTARLTLRDAQSGASLTDRKETCVGSVRRLRQGLDPTGGTRLANTSFSLCHRFNKFLKWYWIISFAVCAYIGLFYLGARSRENARVAILVLFHTALGLSAVNISTALDTVLTEE